LLLATATTSAAGAKEEMRVLMANLLIVLVSAVFFVYTNGDLMGNGPNLIKRQGAQDVKTDVLDIMQKHFDLSLDYLYTGVQYDSQYGERPGLAKKLRGMSDSQWEAGMDALNKYLEHGGSTDAAFVSKLHFKGGETASLTKASKGQVYMDTLEALSADSEALLDLYNNVYSRAILNDGDIAHYLEEKIEKEVEHSHELKGHIVNLDAMKGIGAAVAAFDSNM